VKRFWIAFCLAATAAYAQSGDVFRRPTAPTPATVASPQATAPAAIPARKPSATASAATSAIPSYKDLKFPPLHAIETPKIEVVALPDGMRLYLLEDRELPLVHGTALVRTGNLFDPPDEVGLAGMTGMVMRTGGTAAKTGEQLDEELENAAAHVESDIGESSGSVSFSALKENAAAVMTAFHDVLTSPEFRQDKIDLAKSQLHSSIARRNDDPHSILGREYASILYGRDNPYGWDDTHAAIDRITRADLQNFYKRYFFPKNVMLAVWGDFDSAQMKAQVEKLFADWTVEQPPVPEFPKVTQRNAAGTYLAEKRDVAQTFFSMGQMGGQLNDKDYPALEIMADILGGGFHSRLMEQVRTKMGNAYDISASWGANYDHPGLFEITGSTKLSSTVETIQAVKQEIERIRTAEVSDEELNTAKETARNSLVFAFDTRTKTLSRMLRYEYYGYPKDFIQQYQKALAAVTRADVLRVAKEHLDPAKFALVAVANPAGFVEGLDKLGHPVTPIDLTIPEVKRAAAPSDPASIEKGKQLLAAAQEAVGGAAKLAAVKDYVETSQLDAMNPNIRVKKTIRWAAPNHLREEDELPAMKATVYTDGETGWLAQGQQTVALAGPQAKQSKGELFRSYVSLLLSSRSEGRTVSAIDANTVEIADKDGNVARLMLDPQTHLPARLSYTAVSVAGTPPNVQETYSDFRDVAGIKIPFKISMTNGGKPYGELTVSDFRINTGLKPEDLQKRP
jgi:zinc protease